MNEPNNIHAIILSHHYIVLRKERLRHILIVLSMLKLITHGSQWLRVLDGRRKEIKSKVLNLGKVY